MYCWNKVLWSVKTSHVTSKIQSECCISAWHSKFVYDIGSWYLLTSINAILQRIVFISKLHLDGEQWRAYTDDKACEIYCSADQCVDDLGKPGTDIIKLFIITSSAVNYGNILVVGPQIHWMRLVNLGVYHFGVWCSQSKIFHLIVIYGSVSCSKNRFWVLDPDPVDLLGHDRLLPLVVRHFERQLHGAKICHLQLHYQRDCQWKGRSSFVEENSLRWHDAVTAGHIGGPVWEIKWTRVQSWRTSEHNSNILWVIFMHN